MSNILKNTIEMIRLQKTEKTIEIYRILPVYAITDASISKNLFGRYAISSKITWHLPCGIPVLKKLKLAGARVYKSMEVENIPSRTIPYFSPVGYIPLKEMLAVYSQKASLLNDIHQMKPVSGISIHIKQTIPSQLVSGIICTKASGMICPNINPYEVAIEPPVSLSICHREKDENGLITETGIEKTYRYHMTNAAGALIYSRRQLNHTFLPWHFEGYITQERLNAYAQTAQKGKITPQLPFRPLDITRHGLENDQLSNTKLRASYQKVRS